MVNGMMTRKDTFNRDSNQPGSEQLIVDPIGGAIKSDVQILKSETKGLDKSAAVRYRNMGNSTWRNLSHVEKALVQETPVHLRKL